MAPESFMILLTANCHLEIGQVLETNPPGPTGQGGTCSAGEVLSLGTSQRPLRTVRPVGSPADQRGGKGDDRDIKCISSLSLFKMFFDAEAQFS